MAGGWSKDGAVQDQIDDSVSEAVQRARGRLPVGKSGGDSAERCDECDELIPQARRDALPGVRFCVACQTELDNNQANAEAFNRRGSKDSQLR